MVSDFEVNFALASSNCFAYNVDLHAVRKSPLWHVPLARPFCTHSELNDSDEENCEAYEEGRTVDMHEWSSRCPNKNCAMDTCPCRGSLLLLCISRIFVYHRFSCAESAASRPCFPSVLGSSESYVEHFNMSVPDETRSMSLPL